MSERGSALTLPVAVVMETRTVRGNRWATQVTEAVGVVAGATVAPGTAPGSVIHAADEATRTLWPGFTLELHVDDALSYYSNLRADAPGVFVMCQPDEDGALAPTQVTVSYGEGSALTETDVETFMVPMPGEVYRWVEAFVLEHYVPQAPKKRRRESWKDGQGRGRDGGGDHGR